MAGARFVLYAHCLMAFTCIGLTIVVLDHRVGVDWTLERRLEAFVAHPVGFAAYLACVGSCLAFPALLAVRSVCRMSAWRWVPVVAADISLALAQYYALMVVFPVRY